MSTYKKIMYKNDEENIITKEWRTKTIHPISRSLGRNHGLPYLITNRDEYINQLHFINKGHCKGRFYPRIYHSFLIYGDRKEWRNVIEKYHDKLLEYQFMNGELEHDDISFMYEN